MTDFPILFSVDGTEACWLGSGDVDDDGDETGGFVSVRVARTGVPNQDWFESDERAETREDAEALAASLIDEWADRQRTEREDEG